MACGAAKRAFMEGEWWCVAGQVVLLVSVHCLVRLSCLPVPEILVIEQHFCHRQVLRRLKTLYVKQKLIPQMERPNITWPAVEDTFRALDGWEKLNNTFRMPWKTPDIELFGNASVCYKSFRKNESAFQPYLLRVKNATVFGDGSFLVGDRVYKPKLAAVAAGKEMYERPARHIVDKAFLALHPYGYVYFHMLIEIFPTIWRLFHNGNPENTVVLLAKNNAMITNEIFHFFNMSFMRYMTVKGSCLFVKELYLIQPRGICEMDTVSVQMMRDLYLKNRFRMDGPPRFFYLKHFRNRRIENEDEMIEAIQAKYPLIKIEVPALIGIEYQMRQFQNCLVAMGPHGSGFANAMWMPPGAVIIEFMSSFCQPAVYDLCQMIGMKHYMVYFQNTVGLRPFVVDIPIMVSVFDRVVAYLNKTFHCFEEPANSE